MLLEADLECSPQASLARFDEEKTVVAELVDLVMAEAGIAQLLGVDPHLAPEWIARRVAVRDTTVSDRTRVLKMQGKSLDETVQTVQTELQARYDRQRMTGAIRAAYNEP